MIVNPTNTQINKKGSLLLDFMVAIAIFLLTTSIAIHLGCTTTKVGCLAELHLLKQVIQTAHLEAMATGEDQTIVIIADKNAYEKNGIITGFERLHIGTETINIPHLDNQKKISTPCSFAHNRITCFKSGIVSAGTIYFYANDDNSLFFCLSCPVSQANDIHIYEYENGWISHS